MIVSSQTLIFCVLLESRSEPQLFEIPVFSGDTPRVDRHSSPDRSDRKATRHSYLFRFSLSKKPYDLTKRPERMDETPILIKNHLDHTATLLSPLDEPQSRVKKSHFRDFMDKNRKIDQKKFASAFSEISFGHQGPLKNELNLHKLDHRELIEKCKMAQKRLLDQNLAVLSQNQDIYALKNSVNRLKREVSEKNKSIKWLKESLIEYEIKIEDQQRYINLLELSSKAFSAGHDEGMIEYEDYEKSQRQVKNRYSQDVLTMTDILSQLEELIKENTKKTQKNSSLTEQLKMKITKIEEYLPEFRKIVLNRILILESDISLHRQLSQRMRSGTYYTQSMRSSTKNLGGTNFQSNVVGSEVNHTLPPSLFNSMGELKEKIKKLESKLKLKQNSFRRKIKKQKTKLIEMEEEAEFYQKKYKKCKRLLKEEKKRNKKRKS